MNLIQKIYEEMTTDDDGDDTQSEILKNEYMDATEDHRKRLIEFLLLCVGGACQKPKEGR